MEIKNILAIIDPTQPNERLVNVLQRITSRKSSSVTAFCCVYNNYKTGDQALSIQMEKDRYSLWMDKILAPLTEAGITINKQIEWNPDWREDMKAAVQDSDCDLIIKNSYSHTERFGKSIDRLVLKNARAPMIFLRKKEVEPTGLILAAIKSSNLDTKHEKINNKIVAFCKAIDELSENITVKAVTVYSGSDQFIYPEDFAKQVGLDRQQVQTIDGSPVSGLKTAVENNKAEMLMIGSVESSSVVGRLMGSTAEQLLNEIDSDVIVLVDRE